MYNNFMTLNNEKIERFQGKDDQFLKQGQLLPENLLKAAQDNGISLVLRFHDNYDHSYYFIATFIEDHFKHHVKYLKD